MSKVPSGHRLCNMRDHFILKDYKAVMGAVSLISILLFVSQHECSLGYCMGGSSAASSLSSGISNMPLAGLKLSHSANDRCQMLQNRAISGSSNSLPSLPGSAPE